MARKHRKTHRKTHRRSRRQQKGGAFGIDVAHPIQTASGAPLEMRASLPDGAPLDRVAPSIGTPGGVLSMMGGRRKSRKQRGGACGCTGLQHGGSSGTGGYGFALNNDFGKVYAGLTVGSCVLPQRAGAYAVAPVGVSESAGQLVSHSAGYGYGPASAVEVNGGTSHYLEAIRYARGGRRKHRHSRRCGHQSRKQKQSRRQRS